MCWEFVVKSFVALQSFTAIYCHWRCGMVNIFVWKIVNCFATNKKKVLHTFKLLKYLNIGISYKLICIVKFFIDYCYVAFLFLFIHESLAKWHWASEYFVKVNDIFAIHVYYCVSESPMVLNEYLNITRYTPCTWRNFLCSHLSKFHVYISENVSFFFFFFSNEGNNQLRDKFLRNSK